MAYVLILAFCLQGRINNSKPLLPSTNHRQSTSLTYIAYIYKDVVVTSNTDRLQKNPSKAPKRIDKIKALMENGSLMKVESIAECSPWSIAYIYKDVVVTSNTDRLQKNPSKAPKRIDKIKALMENGSLMKVESIAECSPWSILQYF